MMKKMGRKSLVVKGLLLGACLVVAGVSYSINATSLGTSQEIAGMSMMLDTYYNNCEHKVVDVSYDDAETYSDEDTAEIKESYASYSFSIKDNAFEDSAESDVTIVNGGVADEASGDAIEVTEPVATPEPVSVLANVGISIANEYVNIRKKPNTDSKILGKLYRGSAATITSTEGDWVKIKSGTCHGYIKSEFLAIGFDAEKLIGKYGTRLATVTTTTLKVREERNTECTVLTLVPEGETFEEVKEYNDWVKIVVDESTKGYVAKEYVKLEVEFKEAISIKEERAMIRAARERERRAREAEEEARLERERRAAAVAADASKASSSSNSSSKSSSSNKSSSGSSHKSSGSSSSVSAALGPVNSGTGSSVACYAQNFIGNKYVYGGTSLTNGADCSGFVQAVYSKYGVSLPRTSSSQSNSGSSVSLDNVKPGDLVFYSSGGRVNHVALYIGDGKVVHASNRRDGIKVSNMNYRTPCKARRVVD